MKDITFGSRKNYKNKLHQSYKRLLDKLPCPLKQMHGSDLPNLPKCTNFITLAGRSIHLTSGIPDDDIHRQHRELIHGIINAERFNKDEEWAKSNPSPEEKAAFVEEQFEKYYDRLVQSYERVIDKDYAEGIIRIPCSLASYNPNVTIKSRFGDYNVQYAPVITTIPKLSGHITTSIAKIFAAAVLKHEPCDVITLYLSKPVSFQHHENIISLITEFIDACNEFYVEEFKERHSEASYQYRYDIDPDNL